MYENISKKDIIKQNWDESSKQYDHSPGHGIHSEIEKEAWKSILTRALGDETLDVLDAKVPRTRTLLDSLKYGYWGDRGYFLVNGIKGNQDV